MNSQEQPKPTIVYDATMRVVKSGKLVVSAYSDAKTPETCGSIRKLTGNHTVKSFKKLFRTYCLKGLSE